MRDATRARGRRNGQVRSDATPGTVRVAIYCRQSVDRSETGEFGSIEAQREAVEAFIASQRGEGWVALPEAYCDGGYSGANTERPAFQRLMRDVEAGLIDQVCVYKIDRLSRSLLDFMRVMEVFEAHGVGFTSTTQAFDTRTSTGRMILRLLMTFAEFERETIAERTRDKMLATRRRGMWTGGRPVIGYDVVEKRLVVNAAEAEQVREAFALYEDRQSLLEVANELASRGWTTKTWTNRAGEVVRGRRLTKTSLHDLLRNPLYSGRVRAGDELVEGEHEAIVPVETWERVKRLLAANAGLRNARRVTGKGTQVLQGLARCACGAALTPTHTTKAGRRYSYYQCARISKEGAAACPGSRIAGGDLEAAVVDHLRHLGRDPEVLRATLEADHAERESRRPELVAEARRLTSERARLEGDRRGLLDAIAGSNGGTATPVLVRRLEEVDASLAEADRRASEVADELRALEADAIDPDELRVALADLEPTWAELFPRERARLLALLIEQVVYDASAGEVAITFRPGGPRALGHAGRKA